ncbi:hypothetical protein H9P43_007769 [Blastocladiella emersonii ATCC 22665]|nr:hypothetical protein H9P43_007769 [Blastocladiella emersonii ATCC 22665]
MGSVFQALFRKKRKDGSPADAPKPDKGKGKATAASSSATRQELAPRALAAVPEDRALGGPGLGVHLPSSPSAISVTLVDGHRAVPLAGTPAPPRPVSAPEGGAAGDGVSLHTFPSTSTLRPDPAAQLPSDDESDGRKGRARRGSGMTSGSAASARGPPSRRPQGPPPRSLGSSIRAASGDDDDDVNSDSDSSLDSDDSDHHPVLGKPPTVDPLLARLRKGSVSSVSLPAASLPAPVSPGFLHDQQAAAFANPAHPHPHPQILAPGPMYPSAAHHYTQPGFHHASRPASPMLMYSPSHAPFASPGFMPGSPTPGSVSGGSTGGGHYTPSLHSLASGSSSFAPAGGGRLFNDASSFRGGFAIPDGDDSSDDDGDTLGAQVLRARGYLASHDVGGGSAPSSPSSFRSPRIPAPASPAFGGGPASPHFFAPQPPLGAGMGNALPMAPLALPPARDVVGGPASHVLPISPRASEDVRAPVPPPKKEKGKKSKKDAADKPAKGKKKAAKSATTESSPASSAPASPQILIAAAAEADDGATEEAVKPSRKAKKSKEKSSGSGSKPPKDSSSSKDKDKGKGKGKPKSRSTTPHGGGPPTPPESTRSGSSGATDPSVAAVSDALSAFAVHDLGGTPSVFWRGGGGGSAAPSAGPSSQASSSSSSRHFALPSPTASVTSEHSYASSSSASASAGRPQHYRAQTGGSPRPSHLAYAHAQPGGQPPRLGMQHAGAALSSAVSLASVGSASAYGGAAVDINAHGHIVRPYAAAGPARHHAASPVYAQQQVVARRGY